MARRAFCKITKQNSGKRGITLVELIVVLVIMAIVAASGIFSAVGFVKRSERTQNDKNAETIYQAVQTHLLQMEKSGTISEWVQSNVIAAGYADPLTYDPSNPSSNAAFEQAFDFDGFKSDDEKIPHKTWHMRYVMTSWPGKTDNQSEALRDLIQPYFYDTTILNATVTVELDVEKAYDASKEVNYSARCLSVFVNSREKSGWGSGVTVPGRSEASRGEKLTGYYDGYTGFSVDTVYLPKIEDGLSVAEFSYDNMTGLLSWSADLEKKPVTGTGNHIYYMIDLYPGKDNAKRFFINEDFLINELAVTTNSKGVNIMEAIKGLSDGDEISIASKNYEVHVEEKEVVYIREGKEERVAAVTEKYFEINARVYSNKDAGHNDYLNINSSTPMISVPMRISYISGEYDEDDKPKKDHMVYSLDITDLLTEGDDKASLIVCPNDFKTDGMDGFNDRTGIMPMNKGRSTGIGPVISESGEDGGE